jgi:predicted DNA-binding mobile mystery protein A
MGTAVNRRHTARRALDRRLEHWRELGSATTRPRGGWVRAIREALGMSAADLGRLMHVTDTSVLRLEQSEQGNRARLDTLKRAADALGCDLVYALVPRQPLEQIVAVRARDVARDELARVDHTMTLEAQRVDDSHWQERIESYALEVAEQPGLWRERS